MTVNEIIALARAGFSAENISAFAAVQAQQITQPVQQQIQQQQIQQQPIQQPAQQQIQQQPIQQLVQQPIQQPVQQIQQQPIQQPVQQQIQNQHEQIRNDVLGLLRGYNVGNFQQPKQETADDILAHIIAPEPPKKEGVDK